MKQIARSVEKQNECLEIEETQNGLQLSGGDRFV